MLYTSTDVADTSKYMGLQVAHKLRTYPCKYSHSCLNIVDRTEPAKLPDLEFAHKLRLSTTTMPYNILVLAARKAGVSHETFKNRYERHMQMIADLCGTYAPLSHTRW